MQAFTIPTIYTVIDRFTAGVRNMGRANSVFGKGLQRVSNLSNRVFGALTPVFSEASKQIFDMAKAAALAGAIIGGVVFSYKSIVDYEKAVASFRTIVGGTDKEFAPFQKAINDVAKDSKKSAIDVAAAFEKIAGLNADFARTPDAIKAVTAATITLAKASRDELGVSAENLVGIMNQYSLGAKEADRTINVLAAGQAVGAASITQTSEAFKNFGSVASGANITLEQSVGLIETLGKFSVFGAEAGTKLRGSVLKLQQAGVGYKTGQFQINDALEEAKSKIDKLKSAKEKDAAVLKMFGAENISTGKILLENTKLFQDYTNKVTGTTEAQKAAAINSDTLSNRVDELKNTWVNMLTSSDAVGGGLTRLKNIVVFVTNNLDQIVSVGLSVIKFMTLWKAVNLTMRGVIFAQNAALGINLALQKGSALAIRGNAVALGAYRAVATVATAAQWLWNAAMAANPVMLIVAGVVALTAASYGLYKAFQKETSAERVNNEVKERALENSLEQRTEATLLFQALKHTATGTKEYNDALSKLEAIQPGITNMYKLQEGAIKNIAAAERDLMLVMIERAKVQARTELLAEKTKELIRSQSEGPSVFQQVVAGASGQNADNLKKAEEFKIQQDIQTLAKQIYEDQNTPVMNPKQAQAQANASAMKGSQGEVKGQIDVVIKDNQGNVISNTPTSIMPKTTSTYK